MSTPRRPDGPDEARDAWLSEALRHAPDAQAAPPAALSDAILRQARAATNAARAPQPVVSRSRWRAIWEALARPSVAAGFASVMVATVVGVMWWDQPIDPTIARPPAIDATPPAPATAPAQTEAPPAATAPGEAARATARAEPDVTAAQKRAAPRPGPQRERAATATASPPQPPTTTPEREGPAPFVDGSAANDATATRTVPPPAAAPAPPVPMALQAREPQMAGATDSKSDTARDESRAVAGASALARSAAPKAAAPAAPRADAFAQARPATLSALLASIGAQPQRWGWERGGTVQPITASLQRWLARLDAATAAARASPGTESASVGEAAVLRLYRDGVLSATLRLDDESVGVVGGPRTVLPPDTLAALKQALDDATR